MSIELKITAESSSEFNALLGGLIRALSLNSDAMEDTAVAAPASVGVSTLVPPPAPVAAAAEPIEVPAFIPPVAAAPAAATPVEVVEKRRPGRPPGRKPEVQIEAVANAVNGAHSAAVDMAPPPVEDIDAQPPPLLDLPPLKERYSVDETRSLVIDYVKAFSTPDGSTVHNATTAREMLGGLLNAFGVDKVPALSDVERPKLAKLIHHLAPFGRSPPAFGTFGEIVKQF